MPKLPFMQFYPTDFMMDVQTLEMGARGAWITILCHIWHSSKDGTVRMTKKELGILLKMDPESAEKMVREMAGTEIFDLKVLKNEENQDVFLIICRRITKDKKRLKQKASWANRQGIDRIRTKKRQKLDRKKSDTKMSDQLPHPLPKKQEEGSVVPDQPAQEPRELTPIQKIVKGWKLIIGVPVEGEQSKAWDKVHFKRCAAAAANLLALFGDWQTAVDCCDYVYDKFNPRGFSVQLETVVKHSDEFRSVLIERRQS